MFSIPRHDIPIFATHPDVVYLDNASTTQKPQCVIDAVSTYLATSNANIHRGSYGRSEASEKLYDDTKKLAAGLV